MKNILLLFVNLLVISGMSVLHAAPTNLHEEPTTEIDWRIEPLRITANSKFGATVYIICHVDLNKPILVHYDIYNSQDSLLCQYEMQTPDLESDGNMERKGYLVGPDSLMLTEDWLTLISGEHVKRLKTGDYVKVWGENPDGIGSGTFDRERHLTFNIKSGNVAVSGNVMSLLVGDDPQKLDTAVTIPRAVCFARLFNQNGEATSDAILQVRTGPTDASNLILPAKRLTHACYDRMFNSCTQLEFLPTLPATRMDEFSYLQMFGGCRAAKVPPIMMADTLAYNCCRHMFQECVQLASSPDMPATKAERNCFDGMYEDCLKLKTIYTRIVDWKAAGGGFTTYNWVKGVAKVGRFVCPDGLAEEYGESAIPKGWTVDHNLPTMLENVCSERTTATKILRDGRLIILRDGVEYDVMGKPIWSGF